MSSTTLKHLAKDPILADIIPRIELPDLPESAGVYHDLVSCVVDQTVPSRSRGVYMRKLVGLLGGERPDPDNVYTIQEEDWAAAKMANPKYHTLLRLTDWWHENNAGSWEWADRTDEDIRNRLLAIKGIGPQTVDLILLFTLGRPDVFPVNDYHLKQIMEVLYLQDGEKLKPTMLAAAERWAPYRSLGTRVLLAYKAQYNRK